MSAIALLHDHYDTAHLARVTDEMRALGAPTIRAIWSEAYGTWLAVEGCHRLRAAHALGLTPEIVDVSDEDEIMIQRDADDEVVEVAALREDIESDAARLVVLDFDEVPRGG